MGASEGFGARPMTMRLKLPPGGDVPPVLAARRLGLSLAQFEAALPELQQRSPPFPAADPTTGNFDLDAIDRWNGRKRPLVGYVYFVRCQDFIKIGFTADVPNRLVTLQTSSPFEVDLLLAFAADCKAEGALHRKFKHLRHRNEWFRSAPELLDHIEGLRTSGEILFEGRS